MPRLLLSVLLLVVFVAGAALAYYNSAPVHFDYLFGALDVRLIVLLSATFALAVALTLALCAARLLGLTGEIRRLRRRLGNTETELKNLRNLPPEVGV
jgi:uncharacterized membrane protein YciS (DUF1049 family)